MSRLSVPSRPLLGGAVPPVRPGAAPVGGSPAQVAGAYQQNFRTADELNRHLAGSIERGYQQTAAAQTTANDALQRGYQELSSFIGNQARNDQNDLMGRYGHLNRGVQDRLRPMDTALDWARGGGDYRTNWFNALNADVLGELGAMRPAADRFRRQNAGLAGGYQGLSDEVTGVIDQLGRSARTDIAERYAQDEARSAMDLARRGLGNSTVVDAQRRAARFDRERADIDLTDRLAQTRAGYRTQLGLAGLGFGERAAGNELGQENLMARTRADTRGQLGQFGLMQNERQSDRLQDQLNRTAQTRAGFEADIGRSGLSAYGDAMRDSRGLQAQLGMGRLGFGERANAADTNLALRQLDWMNTISAPYPDAGTYTALGQMGAEAAARRGDPFGGGGGAGGMVTTRGGPMDREGLRPGTGAFMDATYGPGIGAAWLSGYQRDKATYSTADVQAINAGVAAARQQAANPYGAAGQGPTRGGASAGPFPAQFDGGGTTAGGGLVPGDPFSQSTYAPPPTGFGGGFGSITDPQQTAGGGGLVPAAGNPFAPQAGGFGGGFGGQVNPVLYQLTPEEIRGLVGE